MHGLITTAHGPVTSLTDELAVSVTNTKLQIRSHVTTDDDLVTDWIKATTQDFEESTGHQVMLARREYWLDAFPCQSKIELPWPKLVLVESVEYKDADGNWVSFGDGASPETVHWQAHYPDGVPATRGWIEPISGYDWPQALCTESAVVKITFQCGYAEASADVPSLIASALRFGVTDWNRFRGGTLAGNAVVDMPMGIQRIFDKFKYAALQTIPPRRYL